MLRLTHALLVSTSAILISASALAADLPAPVQPAAPIPYVPPFSWTGFYIGGELGWIRTDPVYTSLTFSEGDCGDIPPREHTARAIRPPVSNLI